MAKYSFPPPDPTVKTEDHQLGDFWVRVYVPDRELAGSLDDTKLPLGVYFHGGGWVMGGVDQEDGFCRLLSRQCQMRLVSVEYRLAPRFKFPTALNDCARAVSWALDHFAEEKVTLLGTSAGGNLAFGTALKLVEDGLADRLKGVVTLAAATVHPDAVPAPLKEEYTAYEENADCTVNTSSAMRAWYGAYGGLPEDPYLSCLLHPRLKDLSGAKIYMTEGGADTLRDDARLMKGTLEKLGVSVMYDAYPGYPHYSWLFPSKFLADHQKEFMGNLFKGIYWVNR